MNNKYDKFLDKTNTLFEYVKSCKNIFEDAKLYISKSNEPICIYRLNGLLYARKSIVRAGKPATAIVGMFSFVIKDNVEQVELASAEVEADERGKGIARCLMRELENIALQQGDYDITLSSVPGKETLYEHLGFRIIHPRNKFFLAPMIKEHATLQACKSATPATYYSHDRMYSSIIQDYNEKMLPMFARKQYRKNGEMVYVQEDCNLKLHEVVKATSSMQKTSNIDLSTPISNEQIIDDDYGFEL